MISIDFCDLLLRNILYLNQCNLTLKHLRFSPLSFRPLGLLTQAFQLGILIAFVNTFCFNSLCK